MVSWIRKGILREVQELRKNPVKNIFSVALVIFLSSFMLFFGINGYAMGISFFLLAIIVFVLRYKK